MKYNVEFCSVCNEDTVHRVFRRFGKADRKTGKKFLKRTVTWCMRCQNRKIDSRKTRKK